MYRDFAAPTLALVSGAYPLRNWQPVPWRGKESLGSRLIFLQMNHDCCQRIGATRGNAPRHILEINVVPSVIHIPVFIDPC